MKGWLHLTVGKYAGMSINPKAVPGCYMENNRIYISLGNGRDIQVEPEDEEETISKLNILS